jgi:hypothetical protein
MRLHAPYHPCLSRGDAPVNICLLLRTAGCFTVCTGAGLFDQGARSIGSNGYQNAVLAMCTCHRMSGRCEMLLLYCMHRCWPVRHECPPHWQQWMWKTQLLLCAQATLRLAALNRMSCLLLVCLLWCCSLPVSLSPAPKRAMLFPLGTNQKHEREMCCCVVFRRWPL